MCRVCWVKLCGVERAAVSSVECGSRRVLLRVLDRGIWTMGMA